MINGFIDRLKNTLPVGRNDDPSTSPPEPSQPEATVNLDDQQKQGFPSESVAEEKESQNMFVATVEDPASSHLLPESPENQIAHQLTDTWEPPYQNGHHSSPSPAPNETDRDGAQSMPKKTNTWLIGGGVLLVVLGGLAVLVPKGLDWVESRQQQAILKTLESEMNQPSQVLKLALLPVKERESQLQAIAAQPEPSLERSRARYLLAADLLRAYQGGQAIRMLENLENEYPILAPYILLKRGRGYELSNEKIKAEQTWQELLKQYPTSPVAVEAMDLLGRSNPQYWDQAIANFPKHPRTLDILHQRLKQTPQSLEVMRQIVATAPKDSQTPGIRATLVKDFSGQLTPEDWQAIGDSYWEQREYGKAMGAYAKATETPQNLYRLARSQEINDKKPEAIQNYQKLIQRYPNLPETAQALRRLAGLTPLSEAVAYLDQLIQKFPAEAPKALAKKIDLLEKSDPSAAQQAQQQLLKEYPSSDAAAEYRWKMARAQAKAGNYVQAWQYAQELVQANPDSPLAPKATFWIGKWAQQLGRSEDAKTAFENVLARYPHSYYAWRAAVLLGWQVGDFNSVRFLQPKVEIPTVRPVPPAGSMMFAELYRLGQDQEAIALFTAETAGQKTLNVNQRFTDALLKLNQGQNLAAINQIWSLRESQDPLDQQQWKTLRQMPEYWQALFPLPYKDLIVSWSEKRQVNPLLVAALIRQESRFEREIRSPVGATGLMQVMPSTADWIAPQINLTKFSLTDPNDNINMGTWYFKYTHEEYRNNSALAVASYNAGPGNVAKWLKEFQGNDPDVFIENIPFAETKNYVESVFGNYWNYMQIYSPEVAQLLADFTKK
ncbi:MAG: transglycosylase SLT domain-containing protein [Snowella sp.]|nr:transglycosylase SLT domain-containing protein [Snowella sp.]